MKIKTILITGSSGFIGYHVSKKLIEQNFNVIGIDNHNDYYDPKIKINRFKKLNKNKNFKLFKLNINNKKKVENILLKVKPDVIINLAAQAGVRYSFKNPQKYIESNITGFTNILEGMKKYNIKNLIYASSSSVYGDCKKFPFKENLNLNPLNFYGQTKLMNEKIANLYEKNFQIKTIGLRFFTVYGPYGRPDMFIPKILKKIKKKETLELYNNGNHYRDFTYVEDISEIVSVIINNLNRYSNLKNNQNIFNVCNSKKINIKEVINLIQKITKEKIKLKKFPFQIGDMKMTHGSNKLLKKNFKIKKFENFKDGIKKTISIDFFNES